MGYYTHIKYIVNNNFSLDYFMIKQPPRKAKKERETNPIRAYLTDEDFKQFVKKAKEGKYNSQSAYLRDLVLNHIYGAPQ